jgi:hypothetical protein
MWEFMQVQWKLLNMKIYSNWKNINCGILNLCGIFIQTLNYEKLEKKGIIN